MFTLLCFVLEKFRPRIVLVSVECCHRMYEFPEHSFYFFYLEIISGQAFRTQGAIYGMKYKLFLLLSFQFNTEKISIKLA